MISFMIRVGYEGWVSIVRLTSFLSLARGLGLILECDFFNKMGGKVTFFLEIKGRVVDCCEWTTSPSWDPTRFFPLNTFATLYLDTSKEVAYSLKNVGILLIFLHFLAYCLVCVCYRLM